MSEAKTKFIKKGSYSILYGIFRGYLGKDSQRKIDAAAPPP